METANFEQLRQFCAGYFHQDFLEEAETAAAAVSLFMANGTSATEWRTIASQIHRFVALHRDENNLQIALLKTLGCYYLPSADKLSTRAWLEGVASMLLRAADSTER